MWAGSFAWAWCYAVVSGSRAVFSYVCGLAILIRHEASGWWVTFIRHSAMWAGKRHLV